MEEKKIQLKKKTPSGDVEHLYPQVRLEDVKGLMGTEEWNNKKYIDNKLIHLTEDDLPVSIFGGLSFQGVLDQQDSNDYSSPGYWEHHFNDGHMDKGDYFIIKALSGGHVELPEGGSSADNVKIQYITKDEDEGGSSGGNVKLENGDWLIVHSLTGAPMNEATEENPSIITFAVINNTYQDASDTATGVVKLIISDLTNWKNKSSSAVSGYALDDILKDANVASADKLATKRTIALSGGATGTTATGFGFDGSNDITISVTALDASKLTGTVAFARLDTGTGATQVAKGNHTHTFSALTSKPSLNNASMSSSSSLYAPTTGGEKGQKLIASGTTGAPSWANVGVIYYDENEFTNKAVSGDILITEVTEV